MKEHERTHTARIPKCFSDLKGFVGSWSQELFRSRSSLKFLNFKQVHTQVSYINCEGKACTFTNQAILLIRTEWTIQLARSVIS